MLMGDATAKTENQLIKYGIALKENEEALALKKSGEVIPFPHLLKRIPPPPLLSKGLKGALCPTIYVTM